MNKKQELEYIAKYNIKNGTHFYNLEQIVNHASQNSKPEKQSALQRIGSALTQSEGRSATEKAILDGSAEATSKKLQEIGIDKESANQAVINPAYNTDKTTAALNTTLLTLLPDISAGIPGIIRLGTGMVGGYLGNRGGKYLDDKFGTSFLQGIGSFAGGLAGYSFGNKTIPDIINSAIIRKNLKTGKLEFVGPKNYIGYHQSNTYFETPQFPFNNRWDVINHNADPNGFFLTLNSPATSGFLAKRPYILKFNVNSNKGLVQHGEIKGFSGSKNNIRNKIVKYARRNGADVVHFDGIKDNTLPNQQILFATEKIPQVSAIPGKTNYKLLERPVKISRAERLGIPKSDRKSFNEFDKVMENARLFAEKHNLKIPENIEEVKNMYRDYNSFYRRVNTEFLINGEKELGKYASLTKEEQAKILATRGYPDSKYTYLPEDWGKFSQDRVFVSPTLEDTKLYEDAGGFLVKVQRPFKLSDLKNAHSAAEYTPIYEGDIAGELPMGVVLHTQGRSGWFPPNPTEYLVSTKHLIPREIMHK